jgi:hypothetical protein
LIQWTEEYYSADSNSPPGRQVSQRKYFHAENRIFLNFHRNNGQLTNGYLNFLKQNATNNAVELFHFYEVFGRLAFLRVELCIELYKFVAISGWNRKKSQ